MSLTRRSVLAAGAVTPWLANCSRPSAQVKGGVLAAGQTAAVLLWSVAPDRLLGWARRPDAEALSALPEAAGRLPELGALTNGGAPADIESLAALNPSQVIDYGDVEPKYAALGDRMKTRLGAPWTLIDGALERTADAFTQVGELTDRGERGRQLADAATDILARWKTAPAGPSFFYARGEDGLQTAFAQALAAEVLEGAGWVNVAQGSRDLGQVTREQLAGWNPEAIVTLDADLAKRITDDPVWRRRLDGSRRRLLLLPRRPFGWIDHPPSINRLIGCDWLARNPFAQDQSAAAQAAAKLTSLIYGRSAQPVATLPRWIA